MIIFINSRTLLLTLFLFPIIIVNPQSVIFDIYLLDPLLALRPNHHHIFICVVLSIHSPEIEFVCCCCHCETLSYFDALDRIVFL